MGSTIIHDGILGSHTSTVATIALGQCRIHRSRIWKKIQRQITSTKDSIHPDAPPHLLGTCYIYSIFFRRNILHIFSSLFQHKKEKLHDLHLLIKHCKCMTAPSCTHLWQHFPVRLPRIKSFSRAANTHHKVSRIVFLLLLSLQIPLPL